MIDAMNVAMMLTLPKMLLGIPVNYQTISGILYVSASPQPSGIEVPPIGSYGYYYRLAVGADGVWGNPEQENYIVIGMRIDAGYKYVVYYTETKTYSLGPSATDDFGNYNTKVGDYAYISENGSYADLFALNLKTLVLTKLKDSWGNLYNQHSGGGRNAFYINDYRFLYQVNTTEATRTLIHGMTAQVNISSIAEVGNTIYVMLEDKKGVLYSVSTTGETVLTTLPVPTEGDDLTYYPALYPEEDKENLLIWFAYADSQYCVRYTPATNTMTVLFIVGKLDRSAFLYHKGDVYYGFSPEYSSSYTVQEARGTLWKAGINTGASQIIAIYTRTVNISVGKWESPDGVRLVIKDKYGTEHEYEHPSGDLGLFEQPILIARGLGTVKYTIVIE
jgi:hypothetical protein